MAKTGAWQRKEGKACTKCKSQLPIECFYTTGKKVDGSAKYNSWCKSCIKQKMASYHKVTWGPEELSKSAYRRSKSTRDYLSYLRSKAIQRGGSCISLDELELLWESQSGLCALSGWEMTTKLGSGVVATNCSIDRIDSQKGYESGNVQLVCRAVNVAKSDLSQGLFLSLCSSIVEKANGL